MRNKNIKKAIWLYAVVLFASAFILLLFTYYSQNKFDRNLNDYANKLSIEEKKKNSFQTDLFSATEDNKSLKKQIDMLKKEIENLNSNKKSIEDEQKNLKEKYEKSVQAYEYLLLAENQYLDGNVIECATILLKNCNKSLLDTNAAEKYNTLVNRTFFKASRELYIKGLESYKNKLFKEAINKFEQSVSFDKNSYLADDCYYFISYSYYNMGEINSARDTLQVLLKDYPDSTYKSDSLYLLKQLQG